MLYANVYIFMICLPTARSRSGSLKILFWNERVESLINRKVKEKARSVVEKATTSDPRKVDLWFEIVSKYAFQFNKSKRKAGIKHIASWTLPIINNEKLNEKALALIESVGLYVQVSSFVITLMFDHPPLVHKHHVWMNPNP